MQSDTIDLLKQVPLWLVVIVVIYIGTLLTVGVIRGQSVEFFPPKIGARPANEKVPDRQDLANPASDTRISGTWYLYYGFDTKRTKDGAVGIAEISAIQGNKFKMTIHLNKSKLGRIVHNIFEYEGVVKNRQILATFKSSSSLNSYMIGTMVMFANPPGDKVFGGATYVNGNNKITMDECLLMRI
jgi:hypothetical protein